jgi:hypothetical protein
MNMRRLARLPLVSLLLLLAACAMPGAQQAPHAPPMATATPAGLPAFSDWRIAYLDQTARLHAVTADGRTDVPGPVLPAMGIHGPNLEPLPISADGRYLAYSSGEFLYVVDVSGKRYPSTPRMSVVYDMVWSPDGGLLAVSDRFSVPVLYRLADGQPLRIPSTLDRSNGFGWFIGWIDNEHLAISLYPHNPNGGDPTTMQVASLDITTGQVRVMASFAVAMLGQPWFLLAPDGRQVLLYNSQFRLDPYTPTLDLIDTASGQVTPLPHLAQVVGASGGLLNPVWRPGTEIIASTTNAVNAGQAAPHPWLLDLAHDRYTSLSVTDIPVGWMPNQDLLILATGYQSRANGGPYGIIAARCAPDGQCTVTRLTDDAGHFAFLGFVRTA